MTFILVAAIYLQQFHDRNYNQFWSINLQHQLVFRYRLQFFLRYYVLLEQPPFKEQHELKFGISCIEVSYQFWDLFDSLLIKHTKAVFSIHILYKVRFFISQHIGSFELTRIRSLAHSRNANFKFFNFKHIWFL